MAPSLGVLSIFFVLLAYASAQVRPSDEYLLAEVATPISYDLFIDPRPNPKDNFTFSGTVAITFVATQPVNYFELNVDTNLNIFDPSTPTEVRTEFGANVELQGLLLNAETKILRVVLGQRLVPGEIYVFVTPFSSALRTDMLGLYLSSYVTETGTVRYLAATQFESTYARSAFPCWDEPKYKAVFNLVVARDANQVTTSNMPLRETSAVSASGRVNDTFAPTLPMSSYLVALIVSDFGSIVDAPGNFSVWAPKEDLDQMEYAANYGPRSLNTIAQAVNVPYMLPKMDLVAIPDFNAGAMENWGMITFRESDVMFKEGESSEYYRRYVSTVITHEQGHHWFGDYVSPAWWRYAWLNEAFANYFEVLGTGMVEPSWQMEDLFPSMCNQYAMPYESLPSARPMSSDVYSTNEIESVFDDTIYEAGASKLRMIRTILGEGNFWKALNYYLNQMSLGPVKENDLAQAFAKYAPATPAPFPDILKTWTEQAGYPVITVSRNEQNQTISICQERHFNIIPSGQPSGTTYEADEAWWIPLTWTTQLEANFNETQPRAWLSPTESLTIDVNVDKGTWIIFNLQSVGYYRVNYDFYEWQRLACALINDKSIHPVNRGLLLDDALQLARSLYLSYNYALPITKFLQDETDPIPWNSAFSHFNFLNLQLSNRTGAINAYNRYVRQLTEKIYNSLGFTPAENEPILTTITRGQIASLACRAQNPDCIESANNAFTALKIANQPVTPDLRSAVYCTAVQGQDAEENWSFLWDRYQSTRVATEKETLMDALSCTNDARLLEQYLDETLTGEVIRRQDASLVFENVAIQGAAGTSVALDFLERNFVTVANVYGNTGLGRVFTALGESVNTQELLTKLQKVIQDNSATLSSTGQTSSATNAVNSAASNVLWTQNTLPSVVDWLQVESANNPCPPNYASSK